MPDEKEDPKKPKKRLKQGQEEKITKTETVEKDFSAAPVEGEKSTAANGSSPPNIGLTSLIRPIPEVVRGEDVLKILRSKGYKI